jgi:hypothetical protein
MRGEGYSQDEKCFSCGRPFRKNENRHLVDTRDGQTIYVGPDCYKKVLAADEGHKPDGWKPGYVKLYQLNPTPLNR